jgi:hypothetical protein
MMTETTETGKRKENGESAVKNLKPNGLVGAREMN